MTGAPSFKRIVGDLLSDRLGHATKAESSMLHDHVGKMTRWKCWRKAWDGETSQCLFHPCSQREYYGQDSVIGEMGER